MALRLLLAILGAVSLSAASAPIEIRRLGSAPVLDGSLSDAVWQGAGTFDSFIETAPAKNSPARIRTVAYLGYDDSALFIGIRCEDPDPQALRAPLVQRDNVLGTDDNLAVFLDTRGDKRFAYQFRVSPRGVQADGLYNDLTGEDFGPDFAYESAAQIDSGGWSAELRIPFSSLRYSDSARPRWHIILMRNYPRDFRYMLRSVPSANSVCLICHANELIGLDALPAPRKVLLTPYVTAGHTLERTSSAASTSQVAGGADVKWTPSPNLAIDATLNPDFSQIELDVPQLTVNERFALSLPENRRFFTESSDLFQTPIRAAYTRSITDPAWGLRASGQAGTASYTVLAALDEGGGVVIVPGAYSSRSVPQDFESTAAIARVVKPLGRARGGVLLTTRQISGGGSSTVLGPDITWRPGSSDVVVSQLLHSSQRWDGGETRGYAGIVSWQHNTPTVEWSVEHSHFSPAFRADVGFVPRVGVRESRLQLGYKVQPPAGFMRVVRPYFSGRKSSTSDGGHDVGETATANLYLRGWKNLTVDAGYGYEDVVVGGRAFRQWFFRETASIDPSRRFPRIQFDLRLGDLVDVANVRGGRGGNVMFSMSGRPDQQSEITALWQRQWLDVPRVERLFTADVHRLRGVYNFDTRRMVRVVLQHARTDRDVDLYLRPVAPRTGTLTASALFSYRLNWQTVLFAGYGDDESLAADGRWNAESRGLFIKVSYLVQ